MRSSRIVAHAGGRLVLTAGSCPTTRPPRGTPTEPGLLGDNSGLRPGKHGQAERGYNADDANFASYDAILFESVTVWKSDDTSTLTPEETQELTDYLYAAVHRELAKDYRMVEKPEPKALRLRVAITEAAGAHVVADAVTSIVPQLRTVATLGGMATNKRLLVGAASVEAELTDSVSGRRLAAAVDERWGTKAIRGGILKWSDAKEAFDHWAQQMRQRLAEESGR
jgi:hypothetical protein